MFIDALFEILLKIRMLSEERMQNLTANMSADRSDTSQ